MIITKQWIYEHKTAHEHKTAGGAWNRKQIEALGLKWPLHRGWINTLIATEITDKQKEEFERYAYASNLVRVTELEMKIIALEGFDQEFSGHSPPNYKDLIMKSYISVNDELPRQGQKILAKYEGVYTDRVVYFWRDWELTNHFGRIDEQDGKGSQPATHWKPL